MPLGVTPFADQIADNQISYPKLGLVCASAARTTAQDFGDGSCTGASGIIVLVNVTAWTAGSLTVSVLGYTALGATYTIATTAALVATGVVRLRISPGLTAAANQTVADLVPDRIRIHCAVADATPITYDISLVLTASG